MAKYGLHNKLVAIDGKQQELASILVQASNLLKALVSCKLYLVSLEKEDNNAVWITEVWDSKEEHAHSLSDPKVKSFISQAIPLLASPPKGGQQLEILGGI